MQKISHFVVKLSVIVPFPTEITFQNREIAIANSIHFISVLVLIARHMRCFGSMSLSEICGLLERRFKSRISICKWFYWMHVLLLLGQQYETHKMLLLLSSILISHFRFSPHNCATFTSVVARAPALNLTFYANVCKSFSFNNNIVGAANKLRCIESQRRTQIQIQIHR